MRKILWLTYFFVNLTFFAVHGQTTYQDYLINPYNATSSPTYPVVTPGWNGEYQLFIDDFLWGPSSGYHCHFKIEAVSYPFFPGCWTSQPTDPCAGVSGRSFSIPNCQDAVYDQDDGSISWFGKGMFLKTPLGNFGTSGAEWPKVNSAPIQTDIASYAFIGALGPLNP